MNLSNLYELSNFNFYYMYIIKLLSFDWKNKALDTSLMRSIKFLDSVKFFVLFSPKFLACASLKNYRKNHGLRTPNEGIHQRYLKNWADVADKICFGRT